MARPHYILLSAVLLVVAGAGAWHLRERGELTVAAGSRPDPTRQAPKRLPPPIKLTLPPSVKAAAKLPPRPVEKERPEDETATERLPTGYSEAEPSAGAPSVLVAQVDETPEAAALSAAAARARKKGAVHRSGSAGSGPEAHARVGQAATYFEQPQTADPVVTPNDGPPVDRPFIHGAVPEPPPLLIERRESLPLRTAD